MKLEDLILEVEKIEHDNDGVAFNPDYWGKIVVCKADKTHYFYCSDGVSYWYIPKELTEKIRTIFKQTKKIQKPSNAKANESEEEHVKLQKEKIRTILKRISQLPQPPEPPDNRERAVHLCIIEREEV